MEGCYNNQAVKRNNSFRYAAVAQLDRVTGYEPVGRGFESLQPYQLVASVISLATSFFYKSPPYTYSDSLFPNAARCKRHMACGVFLCPEDRGQDDSHMRRRGLALRRGGHWIFPQKIIPSLDKGRHGFDGQKWAHTSSSPLTIRQYFLRAFPCLDTFLLRQNCLHLTGMDFRVIFVL